MFLVVQILLQILLCTTAISYKPQDGIPLEEILAIIGHCHHIIHYYHKPAEYNWLLSITLPPSVPTIMSTQLWPNTTVQKIWTSRTRCALHILYTEKSTFMDRSVSVISTFQLFPEKEYHLVIVIVKPADLAPDGITWFQDQCQANAPAMRSLLFRQQSWSFFFLDPSGNNGTMLDMASLWLYCSPHEILCLVSPLNLLEKLAEEVSINGLALGIFKVLFPRSTFSTTANYNLWPILVYPYYAHDVLDYKKLESKSWREIMGGTSESWMSAAETYGLIAIEISRAVNATLRHISYDYQDQFDPLTTMGMDIRNKISGDMKYILVGTEKLGFCYCTENSAGGLSQSSNIFLPFEVLTWTLIGIAALGVVLICRKTLGRFEILQVIASLVFQGDVIIGNAKAVFVSGLWVLTCAILACFYTSFIESILVVPSPYQTIETFDQLATAGYHVLAAGEYDKSLLSKLKNHAVEMERFSDKIDSYDVEEYYRQLIYEEKKAVVRTDLLVNSYSMAINRVVKDRKCFTASKPVPIGLRIFLSLPPNSEVIHCILKKFQSIGLIKKVVDTGLYKASDLRKREVEAFAKKVRHVGGSEDDDKDARKGAVERLKFENIKAIVLIWMIANATAVLVVTIEIAYYWYCHHKSNRIFKRVRGSVN